MIIPMGQHLAMLFLLTIPLGGCSLLYDPKGLPPAADAPVDSPPPIFCDQLELQDVTPPILVEGSGVGGSRPGIIVINGKNLVKENTMVSIAAAEGSSRTPVMTIDNANLEIGDFGTLLAVSIVLPIDATLKDEMVPLDVTVAQDCPGGRVTKTITQKLALKTLAELTDAAAPLLGGVHEYSQINVEAGTLAPALNQTSPIILRSTSSVKITNAISLDAAGRTGGPAGGTGGLGGAALGGVGTPGTGPAAGQPSAGVGRFDNTDLGLSTLSNPNRGSGGAGCDGSVLGAGGNGGGSGGSIEIFAAGTLEVAAISARGAAGAPGAAGAGGGGSGGVILLRAGGALTAGNINVAGGGTGHPGRARYDAGGPATVSEGPLGDEHYRGPMFVDPPLMTRSATPELTVSAKPLSGARYFFVNNSGNLRGPFDITIGGEGTSRITPNEDLYRGSNQICLVVEKATATSATRNCIDLAYLP